MVGALQHTVRLHRNHCCLYHSVIFEQHAGITGFETASNYVEEMRDSGVFVSTVNGMWCVEVLHFHNVVRCCVCVLKHAYCEARTAFGMYGGVVWRRKPERCGHLVCNCSFNPCLS
jgi:hypothetical protein